MNVIQAIQDYINKMLSNIQGMKVLLMDKETIGIVSMVFSQSQILQKEVYLFEKIDQKNRELMAHLKAICFLRPTIENFQLLQAELKDPKYGEYHLFFSNTIKKTTEIEELAESDEHEVVQQLQEFFADYYAINSDTFSLNMDSFVSIQQQDFKQLLDRTVDGIASCLLSLKKQPNIRYSGKSELAKKVVSELQRRTSQEAELFEFRKSDVSPILLILDRRDDPVTPLLTPWTYQALVHELLGIRNNRVDLKGVPGVRKDLQEIVLSSEQDPWFKQTMYLNFGDLGVKIKELVDEYQSKTKSNQSIETIDDIKKFVENYPEFRKLSGNVTKHVTLMGELSRIVDKRTLLDLSEIEQDLANKQDHSTHVLRVKQALDDPKFSDMDKLKLVLLYTLRYEANGNNEIKNFTEKLVGVDKGLVNNLIKYAGVDKRSGDVFSNKNLLKSFKKSIARGIKGVENLYTEHKPMLKETLDLLLTNKLKEIDYPFANSKPSTAQVKPPQDIIIFMLGGITFDESLIVHEFNSSNSGVRIIIGGTSIQNSSSFLRDISNNI